MDAFDALLGRASPSPLQPMNLLYALIGVTLGTAVGVLPGIGPALTVALLLPVTYKLDPAGSLIMFAGIYYGGMYGGSTTRSCSTRRAKAPRSSPRSRATRWPRPAAAARRSPPPPSAPSSPALIATLGLAFLAPWLVELALVFGPRGLLRADGARLRHRLGGLRRFARARA